MLRSLILIVLCQAQLLLASTSTVLGSSDAVACYRESQLPLAGDPSFCTAALRDGALVRRDLAATYSNRGIIYSNIGRLEEALEDHTKAIELMPSLTQAVINRGNVFYRMRRYEDALAEYQKVLEIDEESGYLVYYNMGMVLTRLKRFEEAVRVMEIASAKAPGMSKIEKRVADLKTVIDSPE